MPYPTPDDVVGPAALGVVGGLLGHSVGTVAGGLTSENVDEGIGRGSIRGATTLGGAGLGSGLGIAAARMAGYGDDDATRMSAGAAGAALGGVGGHYLSNHLLGERSSEKPRPTSPGRALAKILTSAVPTGAGMGAALNMTSGARDLADQVKVPRPNFAETYGYYTPMAGSAVMGGLLGHTGGYMASGGKMLPAILGLLAGAGLGAAGGAMIAGEPPKALQRVINKVNAKGQKQIESKRRKPAQA